MEGEEVVYLKVLDEERGNVIFEGKVATDVEPHELVRLGCFWEREFEVFRSKATNELVESFKGLPENVELFAGYGRNQYFSGVLYVGADDKVLRKSKNVPSCVCVMMSLRGLSHEECENVFKCKMLEDLQMGNCRLRQIPKEIGRLKKLKKVRFYGLRELKRIPEEIGVLSNLEELWIGYCGIESLPKRLKGLKMSKSIIFDGLYKLQLNTEDLVVFSKLKHLKIRRCGKVLTPPLEQLFWEMIKSTTELRVLELGWNDHNHEMVAAALEENGSIVDGRWGCEFYANIFKRNKANHEKALQCALHLLVIRRFRNALSNVPKEMVRMIAMMLWNTKCDVDAWTRSSKE